MTRGNRYFRWSMAGPRRAGNWVHLTSRHSTIRAMADPDRALAVLISGGLDSAVLLGTALDDDVAVQPIYIRCGLAWEAVERESLDRLLAAIAGPSLRPL